MAVLRGGFAAGTRRTGDLAVHALAGAARRGPEAGPGAGVRFRPRSNCASDVRLWVPRRRGNAAFELDLRFAADGSAVGGRGRDFQLAPPVKNRLRVLRSELAWSQADLAQRLGVSRQTGDFTQ